MDRFTKSFVIASLVYLVAAAALGLWMGIGSAPEWAYFGHVHFNLLGFMAMMIYGVGYFILPRFNARPLRWPGLVPWHFSAANLGLIGMVAASAGRPSWGFSLFSFLSVAAVTMFAVNLVTTLLLSPRETEEEVAPEIKPAPAITPETRMGDIIDRWPRMVDILVENGFRPLADPAHREKVKQLPVTLAMACANHGVDLERMLALLNDAVSEDRAKEGTPEPRTAAPTSTEGKFAAGAPVGPDHIIGKVLEAYPATEGVFKKYYGAACFSCPGQAVETVRQSALMHNTDLGELLRELNEASGT
jgi:hypothetical protein